MTFVSTKAAPSISIKTFTYRKRSTHNRRFGQESSDFKKYFRKILNHEYYSSKDESFNGIDIFLALFKVTRKNHQSPFWKLGHLIGESIERVTGSSRGNSYTKVEEICKHLPTSIEQRTEREESSLFTAIEKFLDCLPCFNLAKNVIDYDTQEGYHLWKLTAQGLQKGNEIQEFETLMT